MTMADYPAVRSLWERTEGMGLNESDTPEAIAMFLERNPGLSLVIDSPDGEIVGAVLCGHDGRRGYLHHLDRCNEILGSQLNTLHNLFFYQSLMRRIRDKTPYSQGDKMMMNAGGGWMIEGSPARVLRDYNQLIEAYNRGNRG